MRGKYTQEQYDEERALFSRSPRWELLNIRHALEMMRWMNTAQQEARLAAVADLLRERKGQR